MHFGLSDEQLAMRDMARRFAEERLAPRYREREAEARIEPELIEEMGSLGLIGIDLPESLGGLDLGSVASGLIIEDIAGGDMNVSYVQLLASLNGSIIAAHARPEVAQEIVPRVCEGKALVALGLTEPGGGSDAANLKLRAARTNSGYALNGEKASISLAAQAHEAVVFARTGEQAARSRGISAFVVSLDAPGVAVSGYDDVGSAAVGRGSIFFEDVEVPAERMLAEENAAFRTVMSGFDYSRALIGLQCLAVAEVSLRETWTYATEREAFGAPIVKNQGVSEPLAEAETWIEAAKLLCYKTLWLRDRGEPHTAEAAMCKWWAPKVAFDVIHRCLLTHGHFAYTRDMPFEQRLRDVMGLQIGDGTSQVQKMIIARERVGRIALPHG